jgi:hypothetical protein
MQKKRAAHTSRRSPPNNFTKLHGSSPVASDWILINEILTEIAGIESVNVRRQAIDNSWSLPNLLVQSFISTFLFYGYIFI